MKQTPRQVRLDPEIDEQIKLIAEVTSLPQIEIIRQAIRAGVQAIKDNGNKMPLPLRLKVMKEEPDVIERLADQIAADETRKIINSRPDPASTPSTLNEKPEPGGLKPEPKQGAAAGSTPLKVSYRKPSSRKRP